MQEISHLATVVWQYATIHHTAILALFGGTPGLWVLVQTFLVKLHINEHKISFVISQIAAALTALATYYFSSSNPNVVTTFAWVSVVLTAWHHLVLNEKYNKYFVPILDTLSKQKADTSPVTESTMPIQAADGLE